MRIGLVIYGSLETISGGYLYDRMLVEWLRFRGDQVRIISLPWRSYVRHLAHNLSLSFYRQLCQAALDVLLQDELNHPSLFILNRRLHGRVGYPIVAVVHHLRSSERRPAWENRVYQAVERHYLATVDGFIFNSDTTRAAVEGLVGSGRPAVVAHPGRDHLRPNLTPAQMAERARQAGPLRILFVGNLIPRKELHTLLDGLSRLPLDSWHLDVVGSLEADPAYVYAIRRQVIALGLTARVTLSGSLPDDELSTHFRRSHVLCVPSSYEGFGIVYLEGMGMGLPAIAAATGGAMEIITHGQNGFLVPPGDAESLAGYLYVLNEDRERLVQMSWAAHQRYLTHPTWAESTERMRWFLQTWGN